MHFLQLEEQVVISICLTPLFRDGNTEESIHLLCRLAVLTTGACERCFGIECQLLEAVVEHVASQLTHQIDHVLLRRTLQHLWQLVELILQRDTATFCFGIGHDSNERFVVMVHRIDRALTVVGTTRHLCPEGFDLRFDGINIDITDYDDRLVIRTIPFMVVVPQGLVFKIIDHRRIADHVTLRVLRTRVHLRVHLFPDTTTRRTTRTPFLEDDTTFGIDFFR